jgi:hypothetical protein
MDKFNSLALATSFADRCHKPQMVILGDDEMFWVCSLAKGEKLIRAGYESAR